MIGLIDDRGLPMSFKHGICPPFRNWFNDHGQEMAPPIDDQERLRFSLGYRFLMTSASFL
jgi:hypothetical protein